jgi:hypothetical protein
MLNRKGSKKKSRLLKGGNGLYCVEEIFIEYILINGTKLGIAPILEFHELFGHQRFHGFTQLLLEE